MFCFMHFTELEIFPFTSRRVGEAGREGGGGVKLQIMGPVLKNVTLKWCAPHTGSLWGKRRSGTLAAQSTNAVLPPLSLFLSLSLSLSVSQLPNPPKKVKNSGVGCRLESGHAKSLLPLRNAIVDETQADVRQ